MKPSQISLEKILALEPACLRLAVREAYGDENGHMNVRWYAAIFDEAGDTLHARLGLTNAFADLKLRKTAPFPPEIASKIEAGVAAAAALDWAPPLCGVMRA